MAEGKSKYLGAGARVKVVTPGPVPSTAVCDKDDGRTSNSVKKRLQQLFFSGDKRIRAEIIYIGSEDEREKLKRKNLAKVQLRDPAGSMIVTTAELSNLQHA